MALHATDHPGSSSGCVLGARGATAFVALVRGALDGGAPALDGRRLPRPRRPGNRIANTGSSSTGAPPGPHWIAGGGRDGSHNAASRSGSAGTVPAAGAVLCLL